MTKYQKTINMNNSDIIKKSKKLSYLLRHNPEDLKMDKFGWVDIDDIIKKLNISFDDLVEIVETNDKKRFRFDAYMTRIRANQGHTINVDLQLTDIEPPDILYHGTSPDYVDDIFKSGGLSKMKRQHVHLSEHEVTAYNVGRRHSKHKKPTILKIDSKRMYNDGYNFYLSDNYVWLTEFVPKEYITI